MPFTNQFYLASIKVLKVIEGHRFYRVWLICAYIHNSPEFLNTFIIEDDELVPKCQIGTLRDTEVFEVTRMPVSKSLI